ncbi:MAG: UDP-N-acetylmuramate--L-alanine ligase [Lentisphaerae bacterium]|nr:UDP-N-acetylmuramate--L-alanine ligase [Lentisphaerota bacterium]
MPNTMPDAHQPDLDSAIRACLARRGSHVHLLGIGGVGMAGLARLLQARGLRVSGCDIGSSGLMAWLRAHGMEVSSPHAPAHLEAAVDWVIRSTAVPENAPEMLAARQRGLPAFRRGDVLPVLLGTYETSVAVSGTHGKTTTTSFITQLLRHAGRDPAWCIGGEVPGLGGVSGAGAGGSLIVEADESDGTVARYRPDIAVVTNIEFDHMEHFRDVAEFEACFRQFMDQAKAGVVYCREDPRARALAEARARPAGGGVPSGRLLSYGFVPDADVRGGELVETADGQTFRLWVHGHDRGIVALPVLGAHHARNALAATAVGLLLGLTPDEIRDGIRHVQLPHRRFERIVTRPDVTVISDYAHHPTEVAAIVRTALRLPHRRLVVIYQPHRHTRTRALGADFPAAFAGVDELVLTPVYAASEAPLRGGSIWDLYVHFREQAAAPEARIPVPRVAQSLAHAWAFLRRELQAGDLFLVVGAGDVEQVAQWAEDELAVPGSALPGRGEPVLDGLELSPATVVRRDEPLGPHTSYGVGGLADVWLEIGDVGDLTAVLRWTAARGVPFSLLGGGYNMLVSDLGVRGIAARLTGPEFHVIREEPGLLIAGAAVPLGRLLDELEQRGYGGFEFLEGIPGTLGGGMQMNAGAWGEGLGDHLAWIRCLNRDGEACIVPRDGLDLGYRRCAFLQSRTLVEAAFYVRRGDPAAIAARRLEIRQRRAWMAGFRSAGSFFKNPENAKSGRLLEDVGMKGRRVGGAYVGAHHANFIIVDGAARAADVQALTQTGAAAVREQTGVELEAEVRFLV